MIGTIFAVPARVAANNGAGSIAPPRIAAGAPAAIPSIGGAGRG